MSGCLLLCASGPLPDTKERSGRVTAGLQAKGPCHPRASGATPLRRGGSKRVKRAPIPPSTRDRSTISAGAPPTEGARDDRPEGRDLRWR